jgi:phosphoribosylanthranilate isomerase
MNAQPTAQRTRIKICGLTRAQDVLAAVAAGVDAIGFVLYAQSPRAVSAQAAAQLAQLLPPFITPVLLFVNPEPGDVAAACALLPTALLQLHGDESPQTLQRTKRALCPSVGNANADESKRSLKKGGKSKCQLKSAKSYPLHN